MNALGIAIAWTALQVTLFCLAGAAVYFAAGRLNPARRAALLSGVLLVTAGIAALAISPWPRWLTLGDRRQPAKTMSPDIAITRADQQPPTATPAAGGIDGTSEETGKTGGGVIALDFLSGVWRKVQNELIEERVELRAHRWRWPSWLAIAALSATGVGVARVLLGLATLARLMRNTACVTDSSMVGLVEQLRGQLHCRPSIELREMPASSAGGSPALVGWRRPVILLPDDWRSWTADARRAILAHEIAHVAHGDLWMWLAAQAGMVIHFYNPLVHWLAARLRLEQELAADARGAAILGGAQTYAALLARMALRQDDARPLWAGCPFFPTRGTLMRRIEMLDQQHQRFVAGPSPSRIARTGLLAALILVAVAVSGLRAPTDMAHADGYEAREQPIGATSPDANGALLAIRDGSYLPADAIAVLSIKPLRLAQSNLFVEPTLLSFPMSFGFGLATVEKDKAPDWD